MCIALALGFAAPAGSVSNGSDRVLLVLGDSLSAAFGMELQESWPQLLQDRLTQDGHAYRVFNSSIVGDTTQGGLARLPRLLAEHEPKIVIIELGGNDGLRGLPLDVTRANLKSMIEQSQAIAARIILAGVYLPPNYGKTYTERFSEMYVSLAGETGVSLIPFLLEGIALDPGLMMEDGIHPTAAAQVLMLDTVWRALEPVLQ
ncbi:MAG TPA: arylesterase [Xanthomonadales bacterium]|nr:arylesterase [Xanthomonadales bacterium]